MPYSCTRRSLYITEGRECILAFRYCCATYRDQVYDTAVPTTPPPTTTPVLLHPLQPIGRGSGRHLGLPGPIGPKVYSRKYERITSNVLTGCCEIWWSSVMLTFSHFYIFTCAENQNQNHIYLPSIRTRNFLPLASTH